MVSQGAPGDREIVSTRVFDAPRERVFRAFSDPSRLARWWGPMTFVPEAGRTRLTWRMRFESAAELERVKAFIPPARGVDPGDRRTTSR